MACCRAFSRSLRHGQHGFDGQTVGKHAEKWNGGMIGMILDVVFNAFSHSCDDHFGVFLFLGISGRLLRVFVHRSVP